MLEVKTKIGYDNEINDVFDEAVIDRNNWQMYGSKKLNCEAYKVTHIFEYDIDTNECKEKENRVSLSDLIDELSIRNKYFDNGIKDEKKKEVELEEKKIEEEFQKKRSENILMHHKNPMRNKYDKDLNIVKEIINILDVKRSDSYYDWIRVGWCLRNIDFYVSGDSGWGHFAHEIGISGLSVFTAGDLVSCKPASQTSSSLGMYFSTSQPHCAPCMIPGGKFGCREILCQGNLNKGAMLTALLALKTEG